MRERGREGEVIGWGFDPNQLLAPYRRWGFRPIRLDQEDNFTAWEPDDIEEFSDSGIGSKAIFDNSFCVEVNLDEESKNSILNLHSKGYAIHEIIKAVFNITRQDGKDYKKYRSAVENFLDCEGDK